MFYTGIDPFSCEPVYIPECEREKRLQKALLLNHLPEMRPLVKDALRKARRMEASGSLLGNRSERHG
jgi:hypothetical protein